VRVFDTTHDTVSCLFRMIEPKTPDGAFGQITWGSWHR
jgi:hypothetical protein